MAKGRDKHQDYLSELNLLGKTLPTIRRKCELSEVSGTLVIHDLEGKQSPEPRSCCLGK